MTTRGEKKFRIGDWCILNNGSIPLLVVDIVDTDFSTNTVVVVAWKDLKGRVHEHNFNEGLLAKAKIT